MNPLISDKSLDKNVCFFLILEKNAMRILRVFILGIFLFSGCIFKKDADLPPEYVTEKLSEEFWAISIGGNAKVYINPN